MSPKSGEKNDQKMKPISTPDQIIASSAKVTRDMVRENLLKSPETSRFRNYSKFAQIPSLKLT